MEKLQYGQIIEVRAPGTSMKSYHRFYRHPDPIMDNIIIWERIIPKGKGKEKKEEHWIIEKDLEDHLSYHSNDGFTEIKIIEDNDKMDKKSSKKKQ